MKKKHLTQSGMNCYQFSQSSLVSVDIQSLTDPASNSSLISSTHSIKQSSNGLNKAIPSMKKAKIADSGENQVAHKICSSTSIMIKKK